MTRLPELTHLELSYKPMTYLGEESESMAKLTHLFLDHNSLQDYSNAAILLSSRLTHLDLRNNQLSVLQPMAPGSPKLTLLNLTGNPHLLIKCVLWIEQVNLKVRATCGHPPELRGQRVKDVHVFKSNPGENRRPIQHPKPTKAAKTEYALISPPKVIKIVTPIGKPCENAKSNTVQKRTTKKRKSE